MRPQIGEMVLLVYRECEKGCWCASDEGERAPLCAEHQLPMMPGVADEGRFGRADGSDRNDIAKITRLGFAARFGYEMAAVDVVFAARKAELRLAHLGGDRYGLGLYERDVPAPYYQRLHASAEE